jgi:hypothetical protein
MPAKIIAPYDGTASEDDATPRPVFARAGADVGLAYVATRVSPSVSARRSAQHEAQLLARGAELFGAPCLLALVTS